MSAVLSRLTLMAVGMVTMPLLTMAAPPAEPGPSSVGNNAIRAEIPSLVRISALDDIDLGTWDGVNRMIGTEPLCVWSTTGNYSIMGVGSGDDGALTITQGSHELPYRARWFDVENRRRNLKPNKLRRNRRTDATALDCNGLPTATIEIRITANALSGAPPGNYTGTLTLVVSAE